MHDRGFRLRTWASGCLGPADRRFGAGRRQRWTLDAAKPEAEAIRAYTADAAYANSAEDRLGSIVPGKLADMVVLSRDILAEEERQNIADAKVTMTVVGGRIVYQSEP